MPDSPRFVLVTGLSGAGKNLALRCLEDLGYYCIDNLPAPLTPQMAELFFRSDRAQKRIAVCVDARAGEELGNLPVYLDHVAEAGIRPDIVFLDSSNKILVQRYSESRRPHPMAPEGNIEEGIGRERALLEPVRARADLVIDTSATSVADLRDRMAAMFSGGKDERELIVTVMSFGYKFGIPQEADLVWDVRFLPNPYHDIELRPLTGADAVIRDYVLNNADGAEFMERIKGLLKFLLPRYERMKTYLTIAIGCTGGRHRSVAIANELAYFLRDLGVNARPRHRDVTNPL